MKQTLQEIMLSNRDKFKLPKKYVNKFHELIDRMFEKGLYAN